MSVDIIPWQIHVSYFQSLLIPKKAVTMCLKTFIMESFQKQKVRKTQCPPERKDRFGSYLRGTLAVSASGTTRL